MNKFEYWIKNVEPGDAQNFLRMAGSKGWELITIIIKQRPKNAISVQFPSFDLTYDLIFKRIIYDDTSYLDEEAKQSDDEEGKQSDDEN